MYLSIKVDDMKQRLFDLITIFTTLTHVETIAILAELLEIETEHENLILVYGAVEGYDGQYQKEIDEISSNMVILRKNIKTLREALLCHESKVFVKQKTNIGLAVFCLN